MSAVPHRPKAIALIVGLLGVTLAVGVSTAPPALGYPQEPGDLCSDATLQYEFNKSPMNWSSTKKGYVNDAFGKLNNPRDHDGSQLVNVANQSTSGSIDVKLDELGLSEFYGRFECAGGRSIKFNQSHSTAAKFFWQVARHEMMHATGAKHGGEMDSQDGTHQSTMTTCFSLANFRNNNIFEQDGKAYLAWLHSSWGSNHVVNANGGFENGKDFWDYPETAELKEDGGAVGPRYVRWFSTDTDQNFRTVTRLITGNDDENYRAEGFFRKPDGAASGVAKVELWRRTVDLPNNPQNPPPDPCSYPDGIVNPNGTPTGTGIGSWVKIGDAGFDNLSNNWKYFNTGWVNAINYEALDFKVVARGRTTQSPGNYGALWIDDLTVQGS